MPVWFPKLSQAQPEICAAFLMKEIAYEISIATSDNDPHYVLSDISWSGPWAWNQLSAPILEYLEKADPQNSSTLNKLLKIFRART